MVTKEYADFARPTIKLRVQIVARASRDRNRKVLFSQDIENPELNMPIRLNTPAGFDLPYLTPISVTIQILSGDAAQLTDGILSLRFKPRRQTGV
jgi:hypothetical protein